MEYKNKLELIIGLPIHVLEIDWPGSFHIDGAVRVKYFGGKIKKIGDTHAVIKCQPKGEAKLFYGNLNNDIEFPWEAYSTEVEAKSRFIEILNSTGNMKIKKILWE